MGAEKKIQIKCQGATAIDPTKLEDFQGNLKSLSHDDYLRLRSQIEKLGFSEPISVWRQGKQHFILNGHQRLRTVQKMIEEGWQCPPLPVSIIDAKNKNEAKRKVLALTSQFGKMESEGLHEFLMGTDIAVDELFTSFRFPEIDLPSFTEEYFVSSGNEAAGADPLGAAAANAAVDSATAIGGDTGVGTQGPYIKMVQLLFEEARYKQFDELVEGIKRAEIAGLDNLTDICFEAVRSLYEEIVERTSKPKSTLRPGARSNKKPAGKNGERKGL